MVCFWLIYNKISHLWNTIHASPFLWHSRFKLSPYDQPTRDSLRPLNSASGLYGWPWRLNSQRFDVNHPTSRTIAGVRGRDWCSRVWRSCFVSVVRAKLYMKPTLLEALKPLQLSDKDGKQTIPPHNGHEDDKYWSHSPFVTIIFKYCRIMWLLRASC